MIVRIPSACAPHSALTRSSYPVRTGELIRNAVWVPVLFKDSGGEARLIDVRVLSSRETCLSV